MSFQLDIFVSLKRYAAKLLSSEFYEYVVWLNYFKLGMGSKIINCVFAVYATSKLMVAWTEFTRAANEKMYYARHIVKSVDIT